MGWSRFENKLRPNRVRKLNNDELQCLFNLQAHWLLGALDGGHPTRKERSVTVDMLGDDFLKAVKTGDPVKGHTPMEQSRSALIIDYQHYEISSRSHIGRLVELFHFDNDMGRSER